MDTVHTAEYWDERYGSTHQVWSGKVNLRLTEQVAHLTPGTAIELGCGEGGDAIWLAQHGWTVLATDISTVAVERAREHASDAGVGDRVTFSAADLRTWQPPADGFDLATLQFLHLPAETYTDVTRRLAAAVRPGGTLLIVNHDPVDEHLERKHLDRLMLTPAQLAATLDAAQWTVEVAETSGPRTVQRDGETMTIHDAIVRAVRT